MLAYKTYVQATDEFDLLGQPYTNYIGLVGRSHPTEWLDRWHAQELPRLFSTVAPRSKQRVRVEKDRTKRMQATLRTDGYR